MKPYSSFIDSIAGPSRLTSLRAKSVVPSTRPHHRPFSRRSIDRPTTSAVPLRLVGRASLLPGSMRAVTEPRTGLRRCHCSLTRTSSPFSPLLALAPLAPFTPALDTLDPASSTTTSILDPLVQFLLSSPFPAGLTILILTFVFRSAVTLPATIWQRRRMERTKRIVQPEMKRINERLAGIVARESRSKHLGYEEYKKELKRQLAKAQSALHKQHKTHPLPTLLFPLAVHIPLLITLSLTIRRTIETPGSPWTSEGWWWLAHLGEVDPTMILPVVGGVVGMINAEAVGWRNKVLREAEAGEEEGKGADIGSGAEKKGNNATSPGLVTSSHSISTPTPISTSAVSTRTPSPDRALPGHLSQGTSGSRLSTKARPAMRGITTTSTLSALPAPPRPKRPPGPSSRSPPTQTPKPRPRISDPNHLTPLASASSASPNDPTSPLASPEKPKLSAAEKSRLTSAIITNAMRFGSILFIPIAAQVPAALALYWTGSMCFTLGQNLVLNGMDVKEKRRREAEAEGIKDDKAVGV